MRHRRHARDKWKAAELPIAPAPWELEDVRQQLVEVACDPARAWADRRLCADAANEIEWLRGQLPKDST